MVTRETNFKYGSTRLINYLIPIFDHKEIQNSFSKRPIKYKIRNTFFQPWMRTHFWIYCLTTKLDKKIIGVKAHFPFSLFPSKQGINNKHLPCIKQYPICIYLFLSIYQMIRLNFMRKSCLFNCWSKSIYISSAILVHIV